jgi:hypothetical protein
LRQLARLSLSLPLAEHGPSDSLYANRALAIANALEGWREQELFFPGRLSLAASGGIDFSCRRMLFEVNLKLPLLFRVFQDDLPKSTVGHVVGFTPVVHTLLGVRIVRWFHMNLNTDLVLNAVPPVEKPRGRAQPAQLVLQPVLLFQLSRTLQLATDFLAPIGGSLGGSTYSGSLRLSAAW